MKGTSIIICCYNSENQIETTLMHIANQNVPNDMNFDVILVDNSSSDNTVNVAQKFWSRYRPQTLLKIVFEPKLGLSNARKAGVLASNMDYLIFCDDDNWLDENYLKTATCFMEKNHEVGALGGQSIGALDIEEPTWWKNEAENYAVGKQAFKSGDVSRRMFLWGAGLVIRKSILVRLYETGFKSLLRDRTGAALNSGGDSEICLWVLLMNYKLWYLEELQFKHFITKDRLTESYLKRLKIGHEESRNILYLYIRFIQLGYFKDTNHSTFKRKMKYLLQTVKALKRRDAIWKEKLQLLVGSSIKLHHSTFEIIRTYELMNDRNDN